MRDTDENKSSSTHWPLNAPVVQLVNGQSAGEDALLKFKLGIRTVRRLIWQQQQQQPCCVHSKKGIQARNTEADLIKWLVSVFFFFALCVRKSNSTEKIASITKGQTKKRKNRTKKSCFLVFCLLKKILFKCPANSKFKANIAAVRSGFQGGVITSGSTVVARRQQQLATSQHICQ